MKWTRHPMVTMLEFSAAIGLLWLAGGAGHAVGVA